MVNKGMKKLLVCRISYLVFTECSSSLSIPHGIKEAFSVQ